MRCADGEGRAETNTLWFADRLEWPSERFASLISLKVSLLWMQTPKIDRAKGYFCDVRPRHVSFGLQWVAEKMLKITVGQLRYFSKSHAIWVFRIARDMRYGYFVILYATWGLSSLLHPEPLN